MDDRSRDGWQAVGETLDWVAGLVATRLDREPADLVWPVVGVGLACGLGAEAVSASAGGPASLVLVGVALTVSGFGMLALLARNVRRRSRGGAATGELDVLEPWLRRLQVLLAAVLAVVVGLAVLGGLVGSSVLVWRNLLELGRVGAVVLAISYLLLDDEVGLPDWLSAWLRRPAYATSRTQVR